MATVTVQVCDVCGEQEESIKGYIIESEGRRAAVDLCAKDAEPMEEVLSKFQVKGQHFRGTRETRRYKSMVATMADIEAAKKKA